MRRGRKAVSPIISTLIMLSIVVAFGTGIMIWSGSSLTSFSVSQGLFLRQGAESVKERVVVEFVEFTNTSPKNVVLHVRNVGQNDVNIGTVSILELSPASTVKIFSPDDRKVEMGEAKSFTLEFDYNTGQVYKITIITSLGNRISVHATA